MGKGCDDTICVDKPIDSILHPNVASMGLYKSIEVEKIFPERPLYRSEFGTMTWKVLHRIGVMFPDNPNKEEKIIFKKMINGLSTHFPCKECSEHFKEGKKIIKINFKNFRNYKISPKN